MFYRYRKRQDYAKNASHAIDIAIAVYGNDGISLTNGLCWQKNERSSVRRNEIRTFLLKP